MKNFKKNDCGCGNHHNNIKLSKRHQNNECCSDNKKTFNFGNKNHFVSNEEQLSMLVKYKNELENELKSITENIQKFKKKDS